LKIPTTPPQNETRPPPPPSYDLVPQPTVSPLAFHKTSVWICIASPDRTTGEENVFIDFWFIL